MGSHPVVCQIWKDGLAHRMYGVHIYCPMNDNFPAAELVYINKLLILEGKSNNIPRTCHFSLFDQPFPWRIGDFCHALMQVQQPFPWWTCACCKASG